MKRVCYKCNVEKNITEFHKDVNSSGRAYACKQCISQLMKMRYKQQTKEERLKYYNNNRERCLSRGKKYTETHYEERRKYYREWERKMYKTNPAFKLRKKFLTRITQSLKKYNVSKKDKLLDICGAGYQIIVEHLEKQFKPGMSWSNHGLYGWHIDHIKPVSSFDLTNPEEVRKCFHYTNLQPLWATENLSKGAHY